MDLFLKTSSFFFVWLTIHEELTFDTPTQGQKSFFLFVSSRPPKYQQEKKIVGFFVPFYLFFIQLIQTVSIANKKHQIPFWVCKRKGTNFVLLKAASTSFWGLVEGEYLFKNTYYTSRRLNKEEFW